MDIATDEAATTAERLRAALVDRLRDRQLVRTERVEAAMRTVPRHLFVPEVPVENAYANEQIYTKRDGEGTAVSAASQPAVVATMLEQLDVEPGHRVLEIGAGTGYNAALLAHLVGETGRVATIELDADLADSARRNLMAAGCGHVRVICGDGEFGYGDDAPYDRLIVTAGAPDLPPAWADQLTTEGRLVVPLRLRGQQRSIAFERADGRWRSRSIKLCTFVPMRGAGAYIRRTVALTENGDVSLQIEDEQAVVTGGLANALAHPRNDLIWTGVTIGASESLDPMDLWLTCAMDGFCRMNAQPRAVERGLVTPALRWGSSAVFDQDTFAYLRLRASDRAERAQDQQGTGTVYEIGVCAHGPGSAQLAGRVADQIRIWDRDHRSGTGPRIEAYPTDTDTPHTGQFVFTKRHTRLVVSWPD